MRIAAFALTMIAVTGASSVAMADRALGMPKLLVHEPAVPMQIVLGAAFFAPTGIFDMKTVQEHPVMRARRDYSLLAALPTLNSLDESGGPLLETTKYRVNKKVMLTFPLAITGRNLVTADIAGAGTIGLEPTGGLYARGGVFTFSGAF